MGDFEDVGGELRARVEQRLLRGLLQVTGEQDRDSRAGGAQDQ